jgi:hypothetical protein
MGAAGGVILFVMTMVVAVILGLAVFAYIAHCFLLITQETAAGNDEVRWPSESYYDWLWQAPYLAWLAGVWLLPAVLLVRVLNPPSPRFAPGLWLALVSVAVLWLMFPVSLLSSLSGNSRWLVFRADVVRRLVKRAPPVLFFYGASGLLLVAGGTMVYFILGLGRGGLMLPAAGLVGATVLFIYARLLGRVTWIISKVRAPAAHSPRKAKRPWVPGDTPPKPRRAAPAPAKKRAPIRTPEGLVQGYGVSQEEELPAPEPEPAVEVDSRAPIPTPDGPVDGYDLSGEALPALPGEEEEKARLASLYAPSRFAERLELREEVRPPALPLVTGVYTFPWYSLSMPHWGLVALGLTLELAVVQFLLSIAP